MQDTQTQTRTSQTGPGEGAPLSAEGEAQPGAGSGSSDPEALSRVDVDDLKGTGFDEAARRLGSGSQGLSGEEAEARLLAIGPNSLEERRENPFLKFLHYFWGPIPWMIEVAAILSAATGDWMDFGIVFALLVINGVIGFSEEHKAADAMAALRSQLSPHARVLRSGSWTEIDARQLVPGDVIKVRLGDVVPADVHLHDGSYLSVDQSALTGESLPVTKRSGDAAYSGTVVKQGEMTALVASTGVHTRFGKTAQLVQGAGAVSHFQEAVLRIGKFLIYTALTLSAVLVAVELIRGASFVHLMQFVLILVVASIPVAMPAVLSVTMALGAVALSRLKAIVTRLESIEEMAGIDILCSDKTGTLTQNRLALGDGICFQAPDQGSLIQAAALASRAENNDAIDMAVLEALRQRGGSIDGFAQQEFVPFDPVSKRTEATVSPPTGGTWRVTKGAPQVVIGMCALPEAEEERALEAVEQLATKGYRTLGVARERDGAWSFLGILPLSDPPRADSRQTIAEAQANGIDVKMVTGDNRSIAREISTGLGMGADIQVSTALFANDGTVVADAATSIERADGYAEVFPEHKYGIVKALQERGHLVGMTGDGVNDAPALKQADVGIAVSGATGAAQAAADLVLTAPGLSVITHAVGEARRIFERMNSYTVYRIAMTVDIMAFVTLAMLLYSTYPLTAVMIVLLALLDDLPIMTIAYDHTYLSPTPVRWQMRRVLTVSGLLGAFSVAQTFVMLILGRQLGLAAGALETLVFLQLVVGGHLMLFVTRARRALWQRPHPAKPLFIAIVATQAFAVLLCGFGLLVPRLPWQWIGLIWGYNLIWMVILDVIKMAADRRLEGAAAAGSSPTAQPHASAARVRGLRWPHRRPAGAETHRGGLAGAGDGAPRTLPPALGAASSALEGALAGNGGKGAGLSLSALGEAYRQASESLAREVTESCRALFPTNVPEAARSDQLGVSAGVEVQRPLIAAMAALAPAIAAAGSAVSAATLAGGDTTTRALAVAQGVTDVGAEGLRVLGERRRRDPSAAVELAHRVALITHRATTLPALRSRQSSEAARDGHPPIPEEWARLSDALHLRMSQVRERRAARDQAAWQLRLQAAAACRDAARHAMQSYRTLPGHRAGRRPRARLLRALAFTSLYCGFAVLRDGSASVPE